MINDTILYKIEFNKTAKVEKRDGFHVEVEGPDKEQVKQEALDLYLWAQEQTWEAPVEVINTEEIEYNKKAKDDEKKKRELEIWDRFKELISKEPDLSMRAIAISLKISRNKASDLLIRYGTDAKLTQNTVDDANR
jgi:hypothetical protein